MQIIPLQPVPAQSATFTVSGQSYQVDVLQKRTGMFVDLYANNTLVIAGAIGQDRNPMVRSAYHGVLGDLIFYDTRGEDDPAVCRSRHPLVSGFPGAGRECRGCGQAAATN